MGDTWLMGMADCSYISAGLFKLRVSSSLLQCRWWPAVVGGPEILISICLAASVL